MSHRTRWLSFPIALVGVGLIIGVALGTVVAQGPTTKPPTAPPTAPTAISPGQSPAPVPPPFQTLAGRGFDQAPLALQASLPRLPFRARLPDFLPSGVSLYHSTVQLVGADSKYAALDLGYIGSRSPEEQVALHIYETNQSLEEKKLALQHVTENKPLTIGSDVWTYLLLSYEQPDGSTLRRHALSRTLEDGVYISLYIGAGTAPDATLDELKKVVLSLR